MECTEAKVGPLFSTEAHAAIEGEDLVIVNSDCTSAVGGRTRTTEDRREETR
jgi:hypothetical protein